MKKKILGLAFIAMTLVAFNGMAQTPTNDNTVKQESVKGKKADKKGNRDQLNPFDGMNLTDAQKSQLQQLDSKRKAAREQQAQTRKENKQQMKADMLAQRKASKKAYLEDVKAIIGPDNYVVFLENMYVNGGGNRDGKSAISQGKYGKEQGNRNGRGDKNGKRSNNPNNKRGAKADNSVNDSTNS